MFANRTPCKRQVPGSNPGSGCSLFGACPSDAGFRDVVRGPTEASEIGFWGGLGVAVALVAVLLAPGLIRFLRTDFK